MGSRCIQYMQKWNASHLFYMRQQIPSWMRFCTVNPSQVGKNVDAHFSHIILDMLVQNRPVLRIGKSYWYILEPVPFSTICTIHFLLMWDKVLGYIEETHRLCILFREQALELAYHTFIQCVALEFTFHTFSIWSTSYTYSSHSHNTHSQLRHLSIYSWTLRSTTQLAPTIWKWLSSSPIGHIWPPWKIIKFIYPSPWRMLIYHQSSLSNDARYVIDLFIYLSSISLSIIHTRCTMYTMYTLFDVRWWGTNNQCYQLCIL